MSGRHRDGGTQRGAVIVEFALVLPILILLVLGIAAFGQAYHVQTTLSAGAREAVRVMALENDATAALARGQAAAATLDSSLLTFAASPSCDVAGTTTTVTLTYPIEVLGTSITLTGKGSMRCNG